MQKPQESAVRDADVIRFADHPPVVKGATRHWLSRAQNAVIEWVEADAGAQPFGVASDRELMVLLLATGALIESAGQQVQGAARSICILPAGRCSVRLDDAGACVVLASTRSDVAPGAILNQATYAPPDTRVAPIGVPFRRATSPDRIRVIELDQVAPPPDNPRLKMFQSATLSINWVEYAGPRDRSALSPHSHADFEQCSLAVAGEFVHHLRVNWGSNATLWREDAHMRVPSPSVAVIPVNLVHTTEGVGEGGHLLIDVFSPPRRDFIARGWVANACEYERPDDAGAGDR